MAAPGYFVRVAVAVILLVGGGSALLVACVS